MSELALPPPDSDDASLSSATVDAAGSGQRRRKAEPHNRERRRSAPNKPLTLEEIQERLRSLMGMVAAGWIKPAQANAIARICQLMMQGLERSGPQGSSSGVPEEILANLARRDPAILDLLSPFLTDDQFSAILGEHANDNQTQDEEPPRR